MIIVDRALQAREAEGRPLRVGMVGAGFQGRGVANQIVRSTPGMRLSVIANRSIDKARRAYGEAGVDEVEVVEKLADVEAAIDAGRAVVTEDPMLLCQAGNLDVVLDVTGAVEFGARVTVAAIEHGKDVVTMNVELDGTVGPLLKEMADAAGVLFTQAEGDQPGVQLNLLRFVQGIGVTPLVAGNIKGLQDPYRNPTTQKGFAERWGQDPAMVTSFADGTKISFEQATVANAWGMSVSQRGMVGGDHQGHVDELTARYDVDELRSLGGVVDYVVGAKPAPGVFVFGSHDDPKQQHYLNLYKLGEGPLYSFYVPYHLCHFEVPTSVARVALFRDPVLQARGGPFVEVITTAKQDLPAGHVLDGLGGYDTYGQCETAATTATQRLLPMGVAEGCRLARAVRKDQVLTYDDVELPEGRLIDRLRVEQAERFPVAAG